MRRGSAKRVESVCACGESGERVCVRGERELRASDDRKWRERVTTETEIVKKEGIGARERSPS